METTRQQFLVEEICDLWQEFCSAHTNLFEYTCEEYTLLLNSDLDNLPANLHEKESTISHIRRLEEKRNKLLVELDPSIQEINQFLNFLELNGYETQNKRIQKLNLLLIDIINSIQAQNKKNQIFLNKALLSIKELQDSFMGNKTYKTYGADGVTKANSI